MERCENGSAKSEGGADRWRLLPALEVLRVPPPRPPSRPRLPIEAVVGAGTCAAGKAGLVLEPPTAIPAQAMPAYVRRASAVAGQAGTARAPQMQRMRAVPTTIGNVRRTFGFRLSRALAVEARR